MIIYTVFVVELLFKYGFLIVNATGKTGKELVIFKLENSLKTSSRKPITGNNLNI